VTEKVTRHHISAIFVLAFVIRIAYAIVAPPFQAPDEYQHFSYAKYVHDEHRLPIQQSPAVQSEELEFHQPPLYYLFAAILVPSTELIEGWPLLFIRFLNILLSMLTIAVAHYFAVTVLKWNRFSVALVCALFALLPTYSYLSATMRNGTLATFFATLGFCLCARTVLDEEQQRDASWTWIGVVAGFAMLTKLTTIGFVAAAAFLAVGTSRSWQAAMRRACWFVLGVLSIAGWWFVRNIFVYGHPFSIVEDGYDFARSPVSWAHEKQSAITIFKTFWAVFGRINEHYFPDIYRFFWWFAGLAMLGVILRYVIYHRADSTDVPRKLAAFFLFAIGASFIATMYYAHNYNSDQGRYMFPVLIPITTFIAAGLNALVSPRYQRLALDIVVFAFAGINAVVLARLAAVYWQ
jgi:hypothetical protein